MNDKEIENELARIIVKQEQNEIADIEFTISDDAEVIPMLVTFHSEDGNYKIYTRKHAQKFLVEMLRMCHAIAEGIRTSDFFLPETKDGGEEDEYQGKGARA